MKELFEELIERGENPYKGPHPLLATNEFMGMRCDRVQDTLEEKLRAAFIRDGKEYVAVLPLHEFDFRSDDFTEASVPYEAFSTLVSHIANDGFECFVDSVPLVDGYALSLALEEDNAAKTIYFSHDVTSRRFNPSPYHALYVIRPGCDRPQIKKPEAHKESAFERMAEEAMLFLYDRFVPIVLGVSLSAIAGLPFVYSLPAALITALAFHLLTHR